MSKEILVNVEQKIPEFIKLFESVNPSTQRLYGNKTERASSERLLKAHGFEKLQELVEILPHTNSMQYAPVITTPYEFEKKLGSLLAFIKRNNVDTFIL